MGGFINPYTVPSAAFWKLGQSKPGEVYNFRQITVDAAQALAREMKAICAEASII
jgi:urea carboxylase